MKKLILITLIFGFMFSGCNKKFQLDEFKLYSTEGWIACIVAAEQSNPQPDKPDVTKCKCNGTGKVKTGDGIHETQCPCGSNCTCGKKDEIKKRTRAIMFTSPKNCSPCKKWEKKVMPELKKANWTFGDSSKLIEVVNCENKDSAWVPEKYTDLLKKNNLDLSSLGVPCFLLLEDEKIISYEVGLETAKSFTDFFYQTGK